MKYSKIQFCHGKSDRLWNISFIFGFQYIKITGILGELKRHAGSSTPCGESIKQRKCHMFVQNHVTLDQ